MKTLNAARDTQNASRTSYVLRRTLMAERKKPRYRLRAFYPKRCRWCAVSCWPGVGRLALSVRPTGGAYA